ncbi:MAG: tRNA epoxyqueuosine(34) reductase QueG [Eubacteriaceae bacterium]|nr:tRNA epoxyqueuosine(34) reductase QueG [Eubacteriaceae bacterium]
MKAIDEAAVKARAKALGFDLVGFCDPEFDTNELERRLTARNTENDGATPFVRVSPQKRLDLKSVMPEVKTVIALGKVYALYPKDKCASGDSGRIAAFACGRDYHAAMQEKMAALTEGIGRNADGPSKFKCFVDNARVVDRAIAWQCGLGFFGKNNLLIHPEVGSAFNIGVILTDLMIDYQKKLPLASRCASCRRCLEACPNGALGEGFALDYGKCVSHLTQKKRLSPEESRYIKDYLYGCDACQLACPYNLAHSRVNEDNVFFSLEDMANLTKESFDRLFGESAVAWRGPEILRRNAKILKKSTK